MSFNDSITIFLLPFYDSEMLRLEYVRKKLRFNFGTAANVMMTGSGWVSELLSCNKEMIGNQIKGFIRAHF